MCLRLRESECVCESVCLRVREKVCVCVCETVAVFEMAYLLTAQYTVHTAYYFLKNSV